MKNRTTLELELLNETDLTIYVSDGDVKCHLPKSLIEYDELWKEGLLVEVVLPVWLAEQEGLV